jgi:uncharacterized membrane protein YbhN (UPF0104 family)
VPGPVRHGRVSLAWPRLPAAAEVAIVAAGYFGYALVRLAVRASRPAAARPVLAETAGYYYGLAHFIITPLVLAWLWLRRPAAFGPLRSALVLATTAANVVFWTWPAAPPRFAVPGMTDILARDRILGAGSPHGPDSLVNLYAAMPSLHVAWAAWCAAAVVAATRGRWRHLAWLYPAATTLDVLATANHFVLDAAAGLAVTALGLLAARATTRLDATGPGPGGAGPAAASPARGRGAATRHRRPAGWGRRLARRWGWAAGGAAAVLIALRAPAVAADARAAVAHGLRLPWLGAAVAAEAVAVAGLVMAQRQLLAAAGARLPARALAAVVFASAGLARLLPAGPAAAAAWQAGQYRRRDPASGTAGVWAVLAGAVASTVAALAVLAAGAAAARWWLLAGGAATLAVVTAAAMAARRVGGAARWLARHAGRSRWRWRLAAGLAGVARHRLGPRRGAAALAASGLSVLGEAGLLAAAFEVAGTPVPWRGLLLACAAGQLGARLVPLPGGLGGMEGGVLGALALSGTRPATALTAVIIYRVAGYWAPGAAGAITAAVLTRRHPARAARPPAPLRPQAPPPPAPGQPPSPRQAASAAGARAARPWPAPGRPARPGLKPARAHPTAGPASRTPQTAKGHAASARSPPEPGAIGPAARHGCGPAPLPGPSPTSRRDGHRPPTQTKKGTCHEHATHPPPGRLRRVRGGRTGRPGRRGRIGRVPAAGHLARRRRPGSRRARHADRAVGRPLAVVHHLAVRRRQRHRRQPDLRAGGGRRRRLRPGRPARVRRPAVRQRAARRLADHRRADPQPQAPHRRLDVLVQQLGRRGADRPGRRQPRRRRPAAAGPPLSTRRCGS